MTVQPYARTSAEVLIRSDATDGRAFRAAGRTMDILDFTDIDFSRFTLRTDTSPEEIPVSLELRGYKRLQIIVRNRPVNEGFGIFQITKHYVMGNYAKK